METTQISELPSQPMAKPGGESENIVMQTREKQSTTYNPNVEGLNSGPVPNSQNMSMNSLESTAPIEQKQQMRHQAMPQANTGTPQPMPQQMNNEMISQLNSELKTASESNMTQLPTRDIPMNTLQNVQDEQAKTNYVPKPEQQEVPADYIRQFENMETMMQQNAPQNNSFDMDAFYEEIQTPIIIFILFFIFQLPSVSKSFNKQFPMLLSNDAHMTFKGYVVKSLIVALLYFLINRGFMYFTS